jgi:uncharacterized protein YndB with AHSA1/START domain
MSTIQTSTNINAPVEKVFAYATDPTNLAEWMTNLTEVTDVTGSGVGQHYHWKFRMAGVPLRGESTVSEHVPNERRVLDGKGGVTSTWTLTFAPHQDGTMLNLNVDYTIPVPVLGKMVEKLVLKRNQRDADTWMENLKETMEG